MFQRSRVPKVTPHGVPLQITRHHHGFDQRSRWLVRGTLTLISPERLIELLQSPETLLQHLLRHGATGGQPILETMFEAVKEDAKEVSFATNLRSTPSRL